MRDNLTKNGRPEFQPLDIEKILDAVKFHFRLRTDKDLANWIGLKNDQYITMYRFRNRITAQSWEIILFKIVRSGMPLEQFIFLDHQAIQHHKEPNGNVQKKSRRIRSADKTAGPGAGDPPSPANPEEGA